MADAALELVAEVEDLLGAAKAQMIGRQHVIALRQRPDVELPRHLRRSAELGGVEKQDRGTHAPMPFAGFEVVRPDPVNADVARLAHSAAARAFIGWVRGRSLTCGYTSLAKSVMLRDVRL